MTKFVSYLRVSTAKQGLSGLGIDAQRTAVSCYIFANAGKLVREVQEIESGKRNDRPALLEALRLCRVHNGTLVIAKLDRLARNVAFISNLMESKVDFVAVDLPQANRMTIHILAAVAEGEAAMISTRTKAALAAAKVRGVQLGRVNTTRDELRRMAKAGTTIAARLRQANAAKRREDLEPVLADIKIQLSGQLTLRRTAAELNRRGIPAARGGEWSAAQVLRLLRTPKPSTTVSRVET
jgi:DNA invertase Pin-like site-specific DNA recombinase